MSLNEKDAAESGYGNPFLQALDAVRKGSNPEAAGRADEEALDWLHSRQIINPSIRAASSQDRFVADAIATGGLVVARGSSVSFYAGVSEQAPVNNGIKIGGNPEGFAR